jgi:hypothetical protein
MVPFAKYNIINGYGILNKIYVFCILDDSILWKDSV